MLEHGLPELGVHQPSCGEHTYIATTARAVYNTAMRRGCLQHFPVATHAGAAVCAAMLQDRPYLCNMAVAPERRGQGFGTLLMRAAEDLVTHMGERDLYLHVRWATVVIMVANRD